MENTVGLKEYASFLKQEIDTYNNDSATFGNLSIALGKKKYSGEELQSFKKAKKYKQKTQKNK